MWPAQVLGVGQFHRLGLPRWLSGKESTCQYRRCQFNPWVGKIPWRRKWQLTPVFLPGKSHGQRSLLDHGVTKRVKHAQLVTKQQQQFHRLVSGRLIPVILGKGWGFPGIEPLPMFQPLMVGLRILVLLVGVIQMLMYYNQCIMRLKVPWKSNLPPSWTQLVLTSVCHVLWPCLSFKS